MGSRLLVAAIERGGDAAAVAWFVMGDGTHAGCTVCLSGRVCGREAESAPAASCTAYRVASLLDCGDVPSVLVTVPYGL